MNEAANVFFIHRRYDGFAGGRLQIPPAKVGPVHLQMRGRGRITTKRHGEVSMNQLFVIDGVSVRQDKVGRYCLNDLHKAAGGLSKHRPQYWLTNEQTINLVQELTEAGNPASGFNPVEVVKGGAAQGTYVCKELVYSYAMWISASFSLKVIRTYDAIATQQKPVSMPDEVQASILLLESASKLLNFSNSSKLGAYQKIQQHYGIPNMMPVYAIDAPADAADGSSRASFSLTSSLKTHGIKLTASQAYKLLEKVGVVEQKVRVSRSAPGGVKNFWSLTAKGCMYGKNVTSPANPRETQPHFFESRFPELLRLLETVH